MAFLVFAEGQEVLTQGVNQLEFVCPNPYLQRNKLPLEPVTYTLLCFEQDQMFGSVNEIVRKNSTSSLQRGESINDW